MEQMSKDIGRKLMLRINSSDRQVVKKCICTFTITASAQQCANRSIQFSFSLKNQERNKFKSEIYRRRFQILLIAQLVERLLCKQNVIGSNSGYLHHYLV